MCGIWGMITSAKNGFAGIDMDLLADMAMVGSQRGVDGTGLIAVGNDNKVLTLKRHLNPFFMLYDKQFPKIEEFLIKKGKAFIGHNRSATKGKIDDASAHPFRHKHITMVHNGTIQSGLTLAQDQVDSEALTIALAEDGPKIFNEINGAWACVWHDSNKNTINFLLNGQRPFCLMKSKYTENYWFASKANMLYWLLDEHNSISSAEIKPLSLDTIHSYDLDTLKWYEEGLPAKKSYSYYGEDYYGMGVQGNGYSNQNRLSKWEKRQQTHSQSGSPTSPAPVTNGPVQPTSSTSIPKNKTGEEVTFEIVQINSKDSMLTYYGLSDRNEGVYFLTPATEFAVGEVYRGSIIGKPLVKANGHVWYQVKARELTEVVKHENKAADSNTTTNTETSPKTAALTVVAKGTDPTAPAAIQPATNLPARKILFRDGQDIDAEEVRTILSKNSYKCFACQDYIISNSYHNCSTIPAVDKSIVGIQCPSCTDSWMKQVQNRPAINIMQ